MPLFGWMKWSNQTRAQTRSPSRAEPVSGHVLLTELLWHVEERECLARQLERENRLAHSALGLRWFQKHPRLRTLVSSSEMHQLEFLCSQVSQVIATNNVQPWELAAVFKHILIDFLNQRQYIEEEGLSTEVWSSQYKKQGSVTPIMPQGGSHEREEIPTVSGYVDRAMRHPSLFTTSRVWDLPYYYPGPLRPKGESTTL